MLKALLTRSVRAFSGFLAAGMLIFLGALPASGLAVCDCNGPETLADQPVIFVGTAIGEVGRLDLSGEPSLMQWSFVANEIYAGDVAVEQFVGVPLEGSDGCEADFERNTEYLVTGTFVDHPDARSAVVQASGCTVSADVAAVGSFGLTAQPPPEPVTAIAGSGRLQPPTSDDQLDPLTLLVFFGLVGGTSAVVWRVWTRR